MTYYPNILFFGIFGISALGCIVLIIRILFKKVENPKKVLLLGLLSIPILDMSFGISFKITNQIKGDIVLSAIDNSFVTTSFITVREKKGMLKAEYESSVAGFGETEKANAKIENDTVLIIKLIDRDYSETLILNKLDNTFKNQENSQTNNC